MSSTRFFFVALVLIGVSASASRARADSPPPPRCFPAELVVGTPAGDVPANWPLFSLTTMHVPGYLEWSDVRLVRVADASAVGGRTVGIYFSEGVAHEGQVRGGFVPEASLIPGEDYDLYLPHCPGQPEETTRYRAIEPIAEPAGLGAIEVSPQVYAANTSFGVAHRMYFVEVVLTPDPTMLVEPWVSTLTWVPQADTALGTWQADRAFDMAARGRVFVACDALTAASDSSAPGPHMFRAAATALGSSSRYMTPEVAGVIGPCDGAIRVDYFTLAPLTAAQMTYWDTVPTPEAEPSCSVAPGRRGGLSATAFGIVFLLAVARARRRR